MDVTVRIIHDPVGGPPPVTDSKIPFYITFEFDRASLERPGSRSDQEREIRDSVRTVFAACQRRLVDYLLLQVKGTS